MAARASRARGLLCPAANAAEAALVEGLAVHPVASLAELCRSLADDDGLPAIWHFDLNAIWRKLNWRRCGQVPARHS